MNDNTYIDLLESIAESNDLLLSDNMIQFASAIWKLAYKQARDDEGLACLYDIADTDYGFMAYKITFDESLGWVCCYLHDVNGDNTFDTKAEAQVLIDKEIAK
jgi:hypothetical protein